MSDESSRSAETSASAPERRHGLALRVLRQVTWAYFVILCVILISAKFLGERNWLCSLVLYLPPAGWLLPSLVLLPPVVFVERKLVWVHLLAALIVFGLYMDFHWSLQIEPVAGKKTLTLLTNNAGQRKIRTLQQFIRSQDPDIIAVQDAWFQGRALSRANPGSYVAAQGQFILISKFEILNSGIVPSLVTSKGPIAAWFEVSFQGRKVVIYNVHFPTPRYDFMRLRGRGFLAEMAGGGGIYSGDVRADYKRSMQERIELAERLREQLRHETRPFLVVGDFNMASEGYLRRLLSRDMADVFAAKGCGYGLTYPGQTMNPVTFFGPWLRLDYVFASKQWKPAWCRVEPRQPADHLAVVSRLALGP